MHQKIEFTVEGVSPLILHNGQLADPLNPFSVELKKVSGKRKKTEADHEEMSRIEWFGSLYLDTDNRIVVPGECIEAMLIDAAKKSRLGREFKSAIISDGLWPVTFDGPTDPKKLFEDKKFVDRRGVKVQNARIMRTRPIFHSWKLTFAVHFLPKIVNPDAIREAVATAGQIVGLCDGRPRFGRFNVIA